MYWAKIPSHNYKKANCVVAKWGNNFIMIGGMQLRKWMTSTMFECNQLISSHLFHCCLIMISIVIGFDYRHVDLAECLWRAAANSLICQLLQETCYARNTVSWC